MACISIEKAGEKGLELLQRAASGEEVVITKGDEPFVRLSTAQGSPVPRQPGSAKGLIEIHDDFDEPLEEFKDYM